MKKFHFRQLKDPNFKGISFVGEVKSKGGQWKDFVIISDKVKDLIRKILFEERREMSDEAYLFSYISDY